MQIFLFVILIISQHIVMGVHSPSQELALVEQKPRIGYRDGILDSSSPSRSLEILPVDEVSIVMPPYHDVSSYDQMIGEYNPKLKTSSPEDGAISTYPADGYARGIPITSELAITRNRDLDSHDTWCLMKCGCWWFGAVVVVVIVVLSIIYRPHHHSTTVFVTTPAKTPRRGF
ncbi:hypothetical protein MJO29_012910 [Puccinia striiformis f. sp. tritici]|uniref:Uncharacterized protein n=2 Tax=Puccinia striiformis TaxID=27350 RepID=A0A0L0VDR7_9BASI|nr:hypothetical protein Pst134EA_024351 [Puccinia striiformis f. sp. tritici]KAI9606822.1 hypothetical protein H4Q26_006361 [Puccinia striiformis f. sp. tritici PST-130]KNE97336.1 hypothetical protein PSTG_09447 [Puccinia striiformis f. sp. tritici PST-78]POW15525.1 hypothetical protein PSTT_02105 [Puccinia striiformis]KAH9444780.1 hypothetical protein Pst134EB_025039 [Puccinia striiformis f. sp. tritici]KAH9453480.1 hypothetical protein Pst134EA_024351 [Puccinia striiformis f. sp. tritici]